MNVLISVITNERQLTISQINCELVCDFDGWNPRYNFLKLFTSTSFVSPQKMSLAAGGRRKHPKVIEFEQKFKQVRINYLQSCSWLMWTCILAI